MKPLCFFLLPILIFTQSFSEKSEISNGNTKYINPIIGAVTYSNKPHGGHGFGKTFPGATTPFGLVQLSPDTRTGGDNGCGYSWNHSTIEGFSFTHMSGVGWYGDLGNFLVMPTTGKLHTNKGDDSSPENGYRSRFSHENEKAEAGYYSVLLTDYNIKTELSAAPHAGIIRFTFPENSSSRIQIDLSRRVGGTSTEQYIKVENENTISGWMKCPPEGGGWGNGAGKANYTVYFYCQFSKPLEEYGVWSADIPDGWVRKRKEVCRAKYQKIVEEAEVIKNIDEYRGKHIGFFTNFKTEEGEQVFLKTGISFVSMEGAKQNLAHDIPGWNFEEVVNSAKSLWADAIKSIDIEGGTEKDKTILYTALYHTMIDPRAFSDVNGNYIGADGKIHQTNGFTYRTIFSGWDVFRSQFPLQTLINPEIVNDEINSLIQMADLSKKGYFPRWEFLNAYSGCMIGNPAVSVVVDAYRKGIRNYDVSTAYQYSLGSVIHFGNRDSIGYTPNNISVTLEYSYFDWCMAQFAKEYNDSLRYKKYMKKSENYKNIWCDEVKWFRAKNVKGEWLPWKGKTVQGQGCVESNPYQQGWFVPHDINGLTELMGGVDSIRKELLTFFEKAPDDFLWNNYYNHPNEPVHHVPFIFNEIGMPEQTQKWTRKICESAYGDDAFGLCGNEDVGQMSAWYVLASIGIHPLCPGDSRYQITSPVFDKITLHLDDKYYNERTFTIIANNNSKENIYIKSIKLNGKRLDRFWISHDEIIQGGTLELEMGSSN